MPSDPDAIHLDNITLVKEQRSRVRDLKGFRKGHQIPTESTEHTNSFVGRIASEDLIEDIEARFADFRKVLKFKRVDLQVTEPDSGAAMISTPWFDYQIMASIAQDDSSEVVWRRQVAEFRVPKQIFSAAFSSAFGNMFDTVELLPPAPIDLADFIDQVEEREMEAVTLDYDRNTTWCHVSLKGIAGQVRLTADRISLSVAQPSSPARLLEAFVQVRTRFAGISHF